MVDGHSLAPEVPQPIRALKSPCTRKVKFRSHSRRHQFTSSTYTYIHVYHTASRSQYRHAQLEMEFGRDVLQIRCDFVP